MAKFTITLPPRPWREPEQEQIEDAMRGLRTNLVDLRRAFREEPADEIKQSIIELERLINKISSETWYGAGLSKRR